MVQIFDKGKNMYSYNEVTGQVFSKVSNKLTFSKLLKFLDKFWKHADLNQTQKNSFKNSIETQISSISTVSSFEVG